MVVLVLLLAVSNSIGGSTTSGPPDRTGKIIAPSKCSSSTATHGQGYVMSSSFTTT